MVSKMELRELYAKMVENGEGDLLHAEISECTRLQQLYELRLQYLVDRDVRLELVRHGAVHMHAHYDAHFRSKIRENHLCVEVATGVLNKWQTELHVSNRSTRMWGDLACKLIDSQ